MKSGFLRLTSRIYFVSALFIASSAMEPVLAQTSSSGPEGHSLVVPATATYTPTLTPTPTPTPTFTATAISSPTNTPTHTPTPRPCDVTRLSLDRRNADNNLDTQVRNNLADLLNLSGLPPGFSCVQTMVNNIVACADARTRNRRNNHYWDDAIAFCFSNPVFGNLPGSGLSLHQVYAVPTSVRNNIVNTRNAYCASMSSIHPDFGAGNSNFTRDFQCVRGNFYLDRLCNRVPLGLDGLPLDPNLRACGASVVSFYGSSPLSLVWEAGADSHPTASVVKFPLDMSTKGDFYTWKGSSTLPLVVYDPSHTGNIKDATQLLGNWSFGGAQVASLDTTQVPVTPPWKDGYEALGHLDANQDGRVSGAELEPLGLWFDNNSNGVSEPGEVVTMKKAGVTSLFYHSDSYNQETKTVRASRGFERTVEGKVVTGASIDWFGGVAPTATSLINGFIKEGKEAPASDSRLTSDNTDSMAEAKVSSEDSFWNGVWEWRLKGSDAQPIPDGYLFMGNHQGGVRGLSFTPSYVKPAEGDLAVALSMFDFLGDLEGSGSEQKLSFTMKHGASVLKTIVSRGSNNDEVRGITETVELAQGASENLRYEWVARRRK